MALKPYRVLLTRGTEQDFESIYDYIAEYDDPANADYVLDQLIVTAEKLALMPERGSYPKELAALGMREFRQVNFKPYRLIYRVVGNDVIIYIVADGRRDMQSLLERRLLSGR
jgi:toxin ParE1/3/4